MKSKSLVIILSSVLLLLFIPFIAMQLTDEVSWTVFDFLVAAVLLLSFGFAIDYVIRKVNKPGYRIAISGALLAILFLMWVELAVGIFGTPLAGH